MERPINVSVVGTGKRFFNYYVDILRVLEKKEIIKIVSVHNRTEKKGVDAASLLGSAYINSITEFPEETEIVINVLKGSIKHAVSVKALSSKKHLFCETPAGYRVCDVEELQSISKKHDLIVEIAEDFAFFPIAQLQKKIIDSGVLGNVTAVFNDSLAYAYHPLPRLHVLKGSLPEGPTANTSSEKISNDLAFNFKKIAFRDGTRYFERMPKPKDHFMRKSGQYTILCEYGLLTDAVVIRNGKDGKPTLSAPIKRSGSAEEKHSKFGLSVDLKERTFFWESTWPEEWTKKHIALADLLQSFIQATKTNGEVRYGLKRARLDIELWKESETLLRYPILKIPPLFRGYKILSIAKNVFE